MARQVSPGRTLECHGLLDCAQNIDAPEAQLARHMKALGAYTNAGGADCRLHVDPLFTYLYIPSIADSAASRSYRRKFRRLYGENAG
jgi:hypothetical protein